jgi:hypothetical protein
VYVVTDCPGDPVLVSHPPLNLADAVEADASHRFDSERHQEAPADQETRRSNGFRSGNR